MHSNRASLPDVGEVVAGKYRLLGVLGRGGMGVVFEGHHELLDRRVAIKVLAPEVLGNHEAVTRFMNEARAAAKITSNRVVHVLDVGMLENGLPYMVMEKLEGLDLAQVLERHGSMPVRDVVDLLVEGIEGVAHAHLEGIIHRDLKPSNMFLATAADRTQVVKVLDFGISKLTGSGNGGSVTSTSAILGSPLYMSPEQLRSSKSIDLRADIWSLGVIAYELLTRSLPFEGDNLVELFATIQARDARPLTEIRPDIPPALDAIVRRCLRRDAGERFQTAHAFAKALVPFGGPRSVASLARLEGHISSKGRNVDEMSSTLPAVPTSSSSISGSISGATPGVPVAHSVTPPTMRSDANAARLETSTGAPWSTTGSTNRPRQAVVGASLAGAATLAVLVGGVFFYRAQSQARAAAGLQDASAETVAVVTPSSEPPRSLALPSGVANGGADAASAQAADVATDAGAGTIANPPSVQLVPASSSGATPKPASPHRSSGGTATTSPPAAPASPPSTPKPTTPASPLNMPAL